MISHDGTPGKVDSTQVHSNMGSKLVSDFVGFLWGPPALLPTTSAKTCRMWII